MKPCRHLDYEEGKFIGCVLHKIDDVRYWERLDPPYEGAPVKVQFCKLRGRINGISACYLGDMPCYELEEE